MYKVNTKYSDAYIGKKDIVDKRRNSGRKLGLEFVENGIILPHLHAANMTYGLGGVVDAGGKFVSTSAFSLCMSVREANDWGGAYPIDNRICKQRDERVIFGGFINNNEWGHFLADWSTRLWYALVDVDSKICFCIRGKQRIKLLPSIVQMIELAGINPDRIEIIYEDDNPIRFTTIVIPESSLTKDGYTLEYKEFFENVKRNVSGLNLQKYDNIYFTRTKLQPRKEIGEVTLEKIFTRNGFKVLSPEKMTASEQVFYIMNCKCMVSIEGSAAHNIIFSNGGTRQIILEKYSNINIRQLFLSEAAEAEVVFIKTYPNIFFDRFETEGPFIIGVTNNFVLWAKEQKIECHKRMLIWAKNYVIYFMMLIVKICRVFLGHIHRELEKRMQS